MKRERQRKRNSQVKNIEVQDEEEQTEETCRQSQSVAYMDDDRIFKEPE
jgi:hypothetical protein